MQKIPPTFLLISGSTGIRDQHTESKETIESFKLGQIKIEEIQNF